MTDHGHRVAAQLRRAAEAARRFSAAVDEAEPDLVYAASVASARRDRAKAAGHAGRIFEAFDLARRAIAEAAHPTLVSITDAEAEDLGRRADAGGVRERCEAAIMRAFDRSAADARARTLEPDSATFMLGLLTAILDEVVAAVAEG